MARNRSLARETFQQARELEQKILLVLAGAGLDQRPTLLEAMVVVLKLQELAQERMDASDAQRARRASPTTGPLPAQRSKARRA